jgi:hypothetical protein
MWIDEHILQEALSVTWALTSRWSYHHKKDLQTTAVIYISCVDIFNRERNVDYINRHDSVL